MERIEPSPAEDLKLVGAALGGDRDDMDRVTERLACIPRILAALNARFGRRLSPEDLEDLTSDVIVIVIEKLGTYAGTGQFDAWLYRIARLELMNALRRRKRWMRSGSELEADDVVAPTETSPSERFEVLHGALERLGGIEADILRLKYFEGLTFREIADRFHVPSSTVKARHYRGMKRIKAWLMEVTGIRRKQA
ncbi:MAG: RNA polymerase sigma factor [Planctomycetota bacterium]